MINEGHSKVFDSITQVGQSLSENWVARRPKAHSWTRFSLFRRFDIKTHRYRRSTLFVVYVQIFVWAGSEWCQFRVLRLIRTAADFWGFLYVCTSPRLKKKKYPDHYICTLGHYSCLLKYLYSNRQWEINFVWSDDTLLDILLNLMYSLSGISLSVELLVKCWHS